VADESAATASCSFSGHPSIADINQPAPSSIYEYARSQLICLTGKLLIGVSSPLRKKIPLHRLVETALLICPSRPTEGRFAIVTNVGQGMRWTRRRADERPARGRRSRMVLMPRRWHQVGGGNSADDGGKKARSPGRVRSKPLKPLRGECRAFSGVTVVTNARVTYTPRAAAGASGARHSLRPLFSKGRTVCKTRVLRAAGMRSCV